MRLWALLTSDEAWRRAAWTTMMLAESSWGRFCRDLCVEMQSDSNCSWGQLADKYLVVASVKLGPLAWKLAEGEQHSVIYLASASW